MRGRVAETHRSFVAGLHDSAVVTEHDGEQLGIQVDLSPLAARTLLGVPLGELTNTVVELEDVLGAEAGELVERLQDEPSWAARFDVLDEFLVRRASEAPLVAPSVERAVELLVESGGRESIRKVATDVGWSRPHLTARFQEEVGLPPKSFARILRFERARSLILASDGTDLARIALACGYSDQPHMNRDFREFSGASPGEFLARRLPGGGGISNDLPFVQDAAAVAA
jgi:AraC-like DNA-binding protein